MAVKISGSLVDGLKMKLVHGPSSTEVETDPPVDNGGQGLSFSPTDLVATGLLSCMMSVMAIHSKKVSWSLKGMGGSVEKHMSTDLPRRIVGLTVELILPAGLTVEQRHQLEDIANNCPVIKSLSPEIKISKTYLYV